MTRTRGDAMLDQDGQSFDQPARPTPGLGRVLDLVSGRPLLQDKVVVLTGAAGGIGRVTAQLLSAAGALMVLVDLDEDPLSEVAALLSAPRVDPMLVTLDASDFGAVAHLIPRVLDRFGSIHGLVNCAGTFDPQPFTAITPHLWAGSLQASLQTAFVTCQAVLPTMLQAGDGSIVNFASTAGEYGSIRPAAHYAAAKAGVIGLTKSLAREAGPAGVRVNAISPGPIDTAGLSAVGSRSRDAIGSRTVLGRLGLPEEVGAAVVFLLSDLAQFITGHVLRVNGGALL